ncbi:carbohydrate ABC transporter membrane protein 2 (CUT1 family) [Hydrogenoanaerobacterium saccharovorans]|uniref:Carbohydrate ABC transporter membrane protein 2, CUT1 family n=1 Tax=Hydrogenoanaerobacterium saccharovorans TaxID=474960 RepID=A0A1H7Z392_9FIRM|nr:carbohydrate ABC transporter permease [Hydrogenoanaerobacterium saccharovorans]RPF48856.1 carbohydrate ABC transporter membrane protein 2 (CUT1 family) [Hydrogenoanaerobacterium saccharovorans]SEM52651.1 carbohydrate ABC transporter membrane protein 2, CUT1 family [Hydrogenoanaerobacterium saccharovorans]
MQHKKHTELQTDLFKINENQRKLMIFFLILLTLLWALPVFSLIKNSLKVNGFANYTFVMNNRVNDVPFSRYFINSVINAIGSSFLVVSVSALAGFSFSKISFAGKKTIYNLCIMCLAVSGPILIVPFFYILKTMHIYNTPLAVIFAEATITLPFGLLMMKNYFDSLPQELMESANIDGANMGQVFFKIYFPLAKPAVINLGVLQIMWSFQDFLFPLMFLTKDKFYTTTVAVNSFKGAYGLTGQNLGRYNAALVLISIPSILIFIFAQKYIVNGVASGAVKE